MGKLSMLQMRIRRLQAKDAAKFGTNNVFCSQAEKQRRRVCRLCTYCAAKLEATDRVLCKRCRNVKPKANAVFYLSD